MKPMSIAQVTTERIRHLTGTWQKIHDEARLSAFIIRRTERGYQVAKVAWDARHHDADSAYQKAYADAHCRTASDVIYQLALWGSK